MCNFKVGTVMLIPPAPTLPVYLHAKYVIQIFVPIMPSKLLFWKGKIPTYVIFHTVPSCWTVITAAARVALVTPSGGTATLCGPLVTALTLLGSERMRKTNHCRYWSNPLNLEFSGASKRQIHQVDLQ